MKNRRFYKVSLNRWPCVSGESAVNSSIFLVFCLNDTGVSRDRRTQNFRAQRALVRVHKLRAWSLVQRGIKREIKRRRQRCLGPATPYSNGDMGVSTGQWLPGERESCYSCRVMQPCIVIFRCPRRWVSSSNPRQLQRATCWNIRWRPFN